MKAICKLNYDDKFLKVFPDCNSCSEFLLKLHNTVDCYECDKSYVTKKRLECKHGKTEAIAKGTPFYRSSTPLHKWFYAIYLLDKSPKMTTDCLSDDLNVTYKTAWRIRDKIKNGDTLFDMIKQELNDALR